MADARRAEEARVAAGVSGVSPMPKVSYDAEAGHLDLVSIERLPIDDELRAFVRQFGEIDQEQRDRLRHLIGMDELYTLIQFAKRSAVLALNEASPEPCEDGLAALAVIDESRIDPRDAAWAAGLLSYAGDKTASDKKQLFDRAIAIATPGLGVTLQRFSSRAGNLADWGYAEIRTDKGLGLIRSGAAPYLPTLPLAEIALAIAARLSAGRYSAAVEVAVDVPGIWFQADCREQAKSVLARAKAAASVNGTLRLGNGGDPTAQMFRLWLVELSDAARANALVGYSGTRLSGRFSIGFSVGRLFGLLVAGSVVDGVEPCESQSSLEHLGDEIKAEIERVVPLN